MTKKMGIIIGTIIFIIVIFVSTLILNYYLTGIGDIKMTWGLNIPKEDKELYRYSHTFRDGERYRVLQYDSNEKIKKLDSMEWVDEIPLLVKESITKYAKKNNFPSEYIINFDETLKYFTLKHKDGSAIHVFYDEDSKYIYIFEWIQ